LELKLRLSANDRGYTARWARYSRIYRLNNPLCADCFKRGILKPGGQVDHIVAVTDKDDPLFWEPTNHQNLCIACHNRKTIKQDGGFGKAPSLDSACDVDGLPIDVKHVWNK
jgi:5-methylcytosine-specific restriction protein A